MQVGSIKPAGFTLCIIGLVLNAFDTSLAIYISYQYGWMMYTLFLIVINAVQTLYYILALAIPGSFFAKRPGLKLIPAYIFFLVGPCIYYLEAGPSWFVGSVKSILSNLENTEPFKKVQLTDMFVDFNSDLLLYYSGWIRLVSYIFNWVMFITFANAGNPQSCSYFASPRELIPDAEMSPYYGKGVHVDMHYQQPIYQPGYGGSIAPRPY